MVEPMGIGKPGRAVRDIIKTHAGFRAPMRLPD